MDGIRRVFETTIPKKLRIEDNFERHAKESTCNVGDPGSIPGQEDPLEKEMATQPRILAWRIPWMEEPDGVQSMGLHRVGHN